MKAIEELLNRKWILKKEDRDLYYTIKDSAKEIRKQFLEKIGYSLIVTPQLIKLEKIPGKPEIWMGIQEFKSIEEYQLYCTILMYLEDKEKEEQIVISEMTEYIQMHFEWGEIDWNQFSSRRKLVHVIKYCLSIHLFELNDGDEEQFIRTAQSEVLYENTGYSRYVLRNFARDIFTYEKPEDFLQSEWMDMAQDRGIVRRQRVYRRLLLSPGIYRTNAQDEDFQYIRNYRNQISHDFSSYFPCSLQVYRSSAYLKLEDDSIVRSFFPSHNTISDLVLYICDEIRSLVKRGILKSNDMEQVSVEKDWLYRALQKRIKAILLTLPKRYREMGCAQVSLDVIEKMKEFGFIEEKEDVFLLYPICGKIGGNY